MGTRRVFSREYTLEAVRWVTERGMSVAQAARDLGLPENVLREWVAAHVRRRSVYLEAAASAGGPGHAARGRVMTRRSARRRATA